MRILLTGGAGYVGCHTALELLAAGCELVLLDNFSNASPAALSGLADLAGQAPPCVRIDVRDRRRLDALFERHDFDAVVHLAALKAVGESMAEPLLYHANNLVGTVHLLECMVRHGVRSLVFSSTATVYAPSGEGLAEDSPLDPASPYARTKLAAEELLRDLCASDSRWGVSILRYFNAGGAHASGRIGESPVGDPQNLLPRMADVAIGRNDCLDVYGDDYSTPDGTCVRDYVHVVDVAQAHVLSVERVADKPGLAIHNLGTGRGHSVREVVAAFERASEVAIPCRIARRRPGDVAVLCADVSRAREELGWSARNGLDDICADLWRWRTSHPNDFEN